MFPLWLFFSGWVSYSHINKLAVVISSKTIHSTHDKYVIWSLVINVTTSKIFIVIMNLILTMLLNSWNKFFLPLHNKLQIGILIQVLVYSMLIFMIQSSRIKTSPAVLFFLMCVCVLHGNISLWYSHFWLIVEILWDVLKCPIMPFLRFLLLIWEFTTIGLYAS